MNTWSKYYSKINILLQTWQVNLYQQTSLPSKISCIFEIGKKYGLHISAPQPSAKLKEQLPIWYLIGHMPQNALQESAQMRGRGQEATGQP
ncbi:hypothetical protein K525DRAFT_215025 [Schizophyllum commune Loenen D]|nr:hypothetical protein K525DRAFT_215025 [Schizophyllum commune Loenen D]